MSQKLDTAIGDQTGRVVIITGANSGIGYYTAKYLANRNATVVMACRNEGKAQATKLAILRSSSSATVVVMKLDLGSFQSIREFVENFRQNFDRLDVLINNAGVAGLPIRETTEDCVEKQMGVNFFGPFLLTGLLLPLIATKGRIVNISSCTHHFTDKNFLDDLQSTNIYHRWRQYNNSKAAVLMWTYSLNRRLANSGDRREIMCVAAHPGYSSTGLLAASGLPMWKFVDAFVAQTAEDGALNVVKAAVDPTVQPSFRDYIGPRFIVAGGPTVQQTSKATWDLGAQQRLWRQSVRVTGENYGGL